MGPAAREEKDHLMAQIKALDEQADAAGLEEEEWAFRYHLEEQVLHLLWVEEEYWRQRGRVKWLLQGDANTAYFHAMANGLRQKCNIVSLNSASGPISGKQVLQEHIYAFYRELLGTTVARVCGFSPNSAGIHQRITEEENNGLALT